MTEELLASYPDSSAYTRGDWHAFASFWHPVATSDEVTEKPFSAVLLDTRLVLYRTQGRVSVALDRCPHRGAQLSRGWLRDDRLICPYHGLHFDGDGACTLIPAQGPEGRIPDNLRLRSFPATERYGIVWTSLSEQPVVPLPDWSLLEGENVKASAVPPEVWQVPAARHAENFNDIAHISWVHRDTFGALPPEAPEYELEQTASGLRHFYRDTGNNRLFERHLSPDDSKSETLPIEDVLFDYRFTFPFASSLEVRAPDGRSSFIYDVIQPISLKQSRVYKIIGRNYDLDGPIDRAVAFEQKVNQEDREIIGRVLPEVLSFEKGKEFHIRADRWSLAYRRALQRFGLGSEDDARAAS